MMGDRYSELSALVARVTRRWRTFTALGAWTRAAAAGALVLAAAWAIGRFAHADGGALILLWGAAAVLTCGVWAWMLLPLKQAPRDLQVARFIEERCPELEDALVTAIGHGSAAAAQSMAAAVAEDAVRRARLLDIDQVISRAALRRTALQAAAASLALGIATFLSLAPVGQAARLLSLYMFPHRLGVEVLPGDVKVRAGESVRVVAKLSTGDAIVPVLRAGSDEEWRDIAMEKGPDGFAVLLEGVQRSFRYAVTAAGASSREYAVTVLHRPRVERIDLHYVYPPAFGMAPRREEDGGDIYGPAGTRVRVTVHADKPVRQAALNLTEGGVVRLVERSGALEGELTITEDDAYRIALADADGLTSEGDTEYFIRTLQDRPPDVRIIRPASDRQVTPLEEVAIESRADDDFGIASLDLVYSIPGGPERAVPFSRSGKGTTVTGRRTLYLEDLRVRPGDVVAYYARARDGGRGKRSSEARSDIFFLEVTPFEEEFVASQTQGGGGGGGGDEQGLEDLIQAQKDIVTATWNLDRRGRESGGRSPQDIRTVARAQQELRTRTTTMLRGMQRATDIRRRRPAGGAAAPPNPDAMAEAVGRAVTAMGTAHEQLEALKTAGALPHEMTALNELLRAQAEVRRREIAQQASGGGGSGNNRRQQDMSSLFDRELSKQQQTNYETPSGREMRDEPQASDDVLDKVRDLAERQDALAESQRALARNRASVPEEERRRELERLTREQSELRRQAEALAQEIERAQQRQQQSGRGAQSGQGQSGQGQGGQGQGGQGGRGSQAGQSAQASERQQASRALQQAAEDMQGAANELRRENPEQASARGTRAAERLRDAEQRVRGAQPDDRRRAMGELQLESRQLADAERRLGSEATGARGGGDRADRARQRAAEQQRLADRAERLEDAVRQLAGGADSDQQERGALSRALQEVERQRLSQRMREAARDERQAAGGQNAQAGQPGGAGQPRGEAQIQRERQEIARGLESLADRLGAAAGEGGTSQQVSEELSRLRRQREELAALDRQLSQLREQGGDPKTGQDGRDGQPGQSGQTAGGSGAWAAASELLEELRRESRGDVPEMDGFNPGRSAPGTEGWKQDFEKWDQLKVQVAAALERAERSAADRLREQQSRDRLNAGTTQSVPEQYRRLIEKYYRALAGAEK